MTKITVENKPKARKLISDFLFQLISVILVATICMFLSGLLIGIMPTEEMIVDLSIVAAVSGSVLGLIKVFLEITKGTVTVEVRQ